MPTNKPYRVSVRAKLYDKPTRRVPPEGAETATDSAVVILLDGSEEQCEDVRVVEVGPEQEDERYRRLLAAWLGLGDHLALLIAQAYKKEKTEANKAFLPLATIIDKMTSEIVGYIRNPDELIKRFLLDEMMSRFSDHLEQQLTELAAEPSKKFGTN